MPLFETCSLRDPTVQVVDAAGAVQARRPNHPWTHPAARSFMDRTSPYIFLYGDTQQPYCALSTAWFLPSLSVHILKIFPFVHRSHFWVGRRVWGARRSCRELGGSGLCDLGGARQQALGVGNSREASVRPRGSAAPLRVYCPGSRRLWCGRGAKEKAKPSIFPQPDG